MDMTHGRAARETLRAHQARTRRGIWALLFLVGALTALSVWGKFALAGVAALLLLFGGTIWLARRHLLGHVIRFRGSLE